MSEDEGAKSDPGAQTALPGNEAGQKFLHGYWCVAYLDLLGIRRELSNTNCLPGEDQTRRPIDFHDLRHTYGTWRAIRGDDLTKISRAMGHSTTAMTERYVNEAEAFDMRDAVPFGPLPELRANTVFFAANSAEAKWPLRGSNPEPKTTPLAAFPLRS
jgi:hypothetical protein